MFTEEEALFWNGGVYEEAGQYRIRKGGEDCWAIIFAMFKEYNLQRVQSVHEDSTEREEMKRQQRMKIAKDMTKEDLIKKEGWMLATDGGLLSCWRRTARKLGSMQDGKIPCRNGMIGWVR